jgi:hypothetical protein
VVLWGLGKIRELKTNFPGPLSPNVAIKRLAENFVIPNKEMYQRRFSASLPGAILTSTSSTPKVKTGGFHDSD